MSRIFLKGGEVVSRLETSLKNILIEDGKIAAVLDPDEEIKGEYELIDCKDKIIIPGVIDAHVHFREPGHEYKEDWDLGSISACSRGVTTVLDMPNNNPPILSIQDLEKKRGIIDGRSYINYGLYIGYDGKNIEEVNNAKNVAGVKAFAANSTGEMGVDNLALEALFEKSNKQIVVHAEDEEIIAENTELYLSEFEGREIAPSVHSRIRSPEAALSAVKNVCELAKKYNKPVHIAHISTEEEADEIEKYRQFGVTCEVTPHHLHLTEDDYDYWKNFIKVNPPVRDRGTAFGLWKALKMGIIDIIGTDHAPHSLEEKEGEYSTTPSGIPGIEMLLPIFLNTVNNEGLSINELVYFCCERPAEIFGIANKGKIEQGYDADIVIVDMEEEKEFKKENILSKSGWSPYVGSIFKGWPVITIINGEVKFKHGEMLGKPTGKEVVFQ